MIVSSKLSFALIIALALFVHGSDAQSISNSSSAITPVTPATPVTSVTLATSEEYVAETVAVAEAENVTETSVDVDTANNTDVENVTGLTNFTDFENVTNVTNELELGNLTDVTEANSTDTEDVTETDGVTETEGVTETTINQADNVTEIADRAVTENVTNVTNVTTNSSSSQSPSLFQSNDSSATSTLEGESLPNFISTIDVSDAVSVSSSLSVTIAPQSNTTTTAPTATNTTSSPTTPTNTTGVSQSTIVAVQTLSNIQVEVDNTTGAEIPFPSSNGVEVEELTFSKRPDATFGNVTAGPNINGTEFSSDTESSAEPEGPVSDGVEREDVNITAPSFVKDEDNTISVQTQIYIVSGTLGGLILFLVILVLALALSISRLKDQIENRHQRYIPADDANNSYAITTSRTRPPGEQIHAYDNSGFSGSHEMEERKPDSKSEVERMGYEMYNGKSDKREPMDPPRIQARSLSPPRPTSTFVDRNAAKQDEHGYENIRYSGAPRVQQDRMSRDSHQLRLEDSVVPMGPGGGSVDRRDYRRGNQAVSGDRYRY